MNILIFDGHCPFCHFWVRQLIRADRKRSIRLVDFETLNSLHPGDLKPGIQSDSVWFINSKGLFQQSDAVIEAMRMLEQPYRALAATIGKIPHRLRDRLYRFVADRRYAIFGKHDTCPAPKTDHQDRFIRSDELGEAIMTMPALLNR